MVFVKGYVPWNKNKSHSIESKNKMSESHKGNHHSEETCKKISDAKKGKPMLEKQKEKLRQYTGEKASNWKGGISWIPYCNKFTKKLKEEIRIKYDRKCFLCGIDEKDNAKRNTGSIIKLPVHHIDYDKEQGCNGKKFELVSLCSKCNIKVNQNREYWKQKIRDKLLFYTIKEYMERFI